MFGGKKAATKKVDSKDDKDKAAVISANTSLAPPNLLPTCDSIIQFLTEHVVDVLPYVGFSDSKFFVIKNPDSDTKPQLFAKLSFYKKTPIELYGKPDAKYLDQPELELKVLKLFGKEFLDTKICPGIVRSLYGLTCNDLAAIAPSKDETDKYSKQSEFDNLSDYLKSFVYTASSLYKAGLSKNKYNLILMEKCQLTLSEYITRRLLNASSTLENFVFMSLMFQIVYTLYIINVKYPKFRHGDLHDENVMISVDLNFKFDPKQPKYLLYIDGKKTHFCVPYYGMTCKIVDFGFSSVPEMGLLSNIQEDKNISYFMFDNDLLILFQTIYNHLASNEQVVALLKALEPNETYRHIDVELVKKIHSKIPTYEEMVYNKIFGIYRNTQISTGDIHEKYTYIK
jgi:hypothetical protein